MPAISSSATPAHSPPYVPPLSFEQDQDEDQDDVSDGMNEFYAGLEELRKEIALLEQHSEERVSQVADLYNWLHTSMERIKHEVRALRENATRYEEWSQEVHHREVETKKELEQLKDYIAQQEEWREEVYALREEVAQQEGCREEIRALREENVRQKGMWEEVVALREEVARAKGWKKELHTLREQVAHGQEEWREEIQGLKRESTRRDEERRESTRRDEERREKTKPAHEEWKTPVYQTGQEWTPNRGITDNGHQTPVQEWEGGRTRDLLHKLEHTVEKDLTRDSDKVMDEPLMELTSLITLCGDGHFLMAFKKALSSSDLRLLVELMQETGPTVTDFLDAETNSRMIRRIIHILQSSPAISLDVILLWLLSVVDRRIHFTASQIEDLIAVLRLRIESTPHDDIPLLLRKLESLKN